MITIQQSTRMESTISFMSSAKYRIGMDVCIGRENLRAIIQEGKLFVMM